VAGLTRLQSIAGGQLHRCRLLLRPLLPQRLPPILLPVLLLLMLHRRLG